MGATLGKSESQLLGNARPVELQPLLLQWVGTIMGVRKVNSCRLGTQA